ncbi:MAG TPA: hypothetical protein PKK60_03575 [archaeon]|nr:hypothetical protein [archaeon]
MKKLLLISLLALVALALSGCTQNMSICGDGVCSSDESNPELGSFCTTDCKAIIDQKSDAEKWGVKFYGGCTLKSGEKFSSEKAVQMICCGGQSYEASKVGCCDEKPYLLATQGCCNKTRYTLATQGCCKTTISGGLGEVFVKSQQCCRSTTAGNIALFNKDSWKPLTSQVCRGEKFCQTNDCGETREATGSNANLCCTVTGNNDRTFTENRNYLTVNNCFDDKTNVWSKLRSDAEQQNEDWKAECESGGANCSFIPGSCEVEWDPNCVRSMAVSLTGSCNIVSECVNRYKGPQCK